MKMRSLERAKPILEFFQLLELLPYFDGAFRCFNTGNKGSVSQRAAKILFVKLRE